jgi:hypothetical protein
MSNYELTLSKCTNDPDNKCFRDVSLTNYSKHQERLKSFFKGLKSKHDIDNILKDRLFQKMQAMDIKSTKQRITLQYEESITMEDKTKVVVNLCETCFVHMHDHCCLKTYANWKKIIKRRLLFDHVESKIQSVSSPTKLSTKHYANIHEARAALYHLKLSEEQLQLACVPESEKYRQVFWWMSDFFQLIGDRAPNRDNLIQLPGIYTKKSIYTIYKDHVETTYTADEHTVLSFSGFKTLWLDIFPNVKITKFIQVTGKCSCCHWLYERQEHFRSENDLRAIRYFANVHRILISKERSVYMYKRQLAQKSPDLYMSLIIDGMSQDHCILPYCANKVAKSTILKQKVVGAKQHGFSKSFYRLFPLVSGGTNVACEVVMYEIERRMKHSLKDNLVMPDQLFLQIDGGPENTSKVIIFSNLCP